MYSHGTPPCPRPSSWEMCGGTDVVAGVRVPVTSGTVTEFVGWNTRRGRTGGARGVRSDPECLTGNRTGTGGGSVGRW